MRRLLVSACCVSLVIACLAALPRAQSGLAQISGTVRDTSGGVLPGVTVELSSPAIVEGTRSTTTDGAGGYRFVDLPPGIYSMKFTLTGFATVESRGMELPDGFKGRIDAVMKVGGIAETMTVTGAAPIVNVQSAARVAVLDRDALDNIPTGKTVPGVGQLILGTSLNGPDAGASPAASPQTYQSLHGTPVSAANNTVMVDGMVINGLMLDGQVRTYTPLPPNSASGDPQGFNTEAYDKIDDNRWSQVAHTPLSTFSIDVDTASYANVRRFLNQGQRPPKDAVRIEELINYFSYNYPEPRGEHPFSINATLGECPWNPHHRLALIGLQAKRLDKSEMPPRNLVFLIDVSGSMNMPQKLPLVKQSLSMLAQTLTASDNIALVVYAGAAGLVLPPTEGNDRARIADAISRLQAGGSTNGGQGIQLAYHVARQSFIKGGVNRVILATDGDFNVGISSPSDLVRLIEQERESGVTLSVLGFGMGNLKDGTMDKLADRGNGNYSYIDSLAEARKVLVHEAGGTLVTVAKDVKLQIEFNPRTVAAYRLIGYENRVLADRDFNDDKKDAGDMGAGHSVTALYEIVPAGQGIDTPGVDPLKYQQAAGMSPNAWQNEAMTVKLRYKQPDGNVSSLLERTVGTRLTMSPELGFASAVAEFGMLLRDSDFKGSASFDHARRLAERYSDDDPYGHRAEFVKLISMAERLIGSR